jgi:hypothetical protein
LQPAQREYRAAGSENGRDDRAQRGAAQGQELGGSGERRRTPPMAGDFASRVRISGGRRLYIECRGRGAAPTLTCTREDRARDGLTNPANRSHQRDQRPYVATVSAPSASDSATSIE